MGRISKIKVKDDLKQAVEEAVDQLGGFDKFIKPNDFVLLKPNFNTADPFPASSDLEFLKVVSELVCESKPRSVVVGDCSAISVKTEKVIEQRKFYELEELNPLIKVINFNKDKWVKKEIPGAKYLKKVSLPKILDQVDKLILLPCLKTHSQADFTGALKLAVGFIKPSQRNRLHAFHLQEKIGEVNKLINPDLIIMDARKCFITQGPSHGQVREPGLILASEDRIEIDLEGIKIIQSFDGNDLQGIKPDQLSQIKRAREMGV